MAKTGKDGKGRVVPAVKTANNTQAASLDDDQTQVPFALPSFTTQSRDVDNLAAGSATALPNATIV